MTAEGRIHRAEQIVGEQRDPAGEFGALGHPTEGPVADSAVEAMYLQEISRLQRAVMGETNSAQIHGRFVDGTIYCPVAGRRFNLGLSHKYSAPFVCPGCNVSIPARR